MTKILLTSGFALLASASFASLTSKLTVDNVYSLYVSTSDATTGTLVGAEGDWPSVETYASNLMPGQDYYLHVVGQNQGGPAGFIGEFTLSADDAHMFANGTKSLLTNGTDWTVNDTGFGTSMVAASVTADNGGGPWGGNASSVSSDAKWIWNSTTASSDAGNDPLYFSAKVVAAPVPEPASVAALGLGALGLLRRRKK